MCGQFLLLLALTCLIGLNALNEQYFSKLQSASDITASSIDKIYQEWQIDKYPNFLKSCFMHKLSWELMKLKFQKKIMTALAAKSPTKFVISFTGRYVLYPVI
jgi:hypothetical protein